MSLTFVESSQHKEAAAEKGKSGNEYYGHVFIHSPLPLKKDPAWQDSSSSALSSGQPHKKVPSAVALHPGLRQRRPYLPQKGNNWLVASLCISPNLVENTCFGIHFFASSFFSKYKR